MVGHAVDQHGKAECRTDSLFAGYGKVATHGLGKAFDQGKAKPGAAITPRDFRAPLRVRAEQLPCFGATQSNAAIDDGKDQPDAIARSWFGGNRERDRPLLGKFHRVVSKIFKRCTQPQTIAGYHGGQIIGDLDVRTDCLVAGARGKRCAHCLRECPWREWLSTQYETLRMSLNPIDD